MYFLTQNIYLSLVSYPEMVQYYAALIKYFVKLNWVFISNPCAIKCDGYVIFKLYINHTLEYIDIFSILQCNELFKFLDTCHKYFLGYTNPSASSSFSRQIEYWTLNFNIYFTIINICCDNKYVLLKRRISEHIIKYLAYFI